MKNPVKLPESEEQRRNREAVESIAKNIAALAKAVSALLEGPLKGRAIVILLASSSGLSQTVVQQVLAALSCMEQDWLNK